MTMALAQLCVAHGLRTEILCFKKSPSMVAVPDGVEVTFLLNEGTRLASWAFLRALWRTARDRLRRCTVVVATQEFLPSQVTGLISRLTAGRRQTIAWVHCPLDAFARRGGAIHASWINSIAYRLFDRIVFVSEAARSGSQYTLGSLASSRRSLVIPNWVAAPASTASSAPTVDRHAGIRLVGVGRLVPEKGFDLAIRALALAIRALASGIEREGSRHRLIIAGDGPEREALRRLADELNVADQVHFVGAMDDVSAVLRTADCFLCTSTFEGFGLALAEALVHGLPIISTRFEGEPTRFVEHGTNGLLVDRNADAVARAIQEAASCPSRWPEWSQASLRISRGEWLRAGQSLWLHLLDEAPR